MPQNNDNPLLGIELKPKSKSNNPLLGIELSVKEKQEPTVKEQAPVKVAPGDDIPMARIDEKTSAIPESIKNPIALTKQKVKEYANDPVAQLKNKSSVIANYLDGLKETSPNQYKAVKTALTSTYPGDPSSYKTEDVFALDKKENLNDGDVSIALKQNKGGQISEFVKDNIYKKAIVYSVQKKYEELNDLKRKNESKLKEIASLNDKILYFNFDFDKKPKTEEERTVYNENVVKQNNLIGQLNILFADPNIQAQKKTEQDFTQEEKFVNEKLKDRTVQNNIDPIAKWAAGFTGNVKGMLSSYGNALKMEAIQDVRKNIEAEKKLLEKFGEEKKIPWQLKGGVTFGLKEDDYENQWMYTMGDQLEKELRETAALITPVPPTEYVARQKALSVASAQKGIITGPATSMAGSLTDPDWWQYGSPQTVAGVSTLIAPAIAATALTSSVVGAPEGVGLAAITARLIPATVGAFTSRTFEGYMEAGGFLQEEYDKIKSDHPELTEREIYNRLYPGYNTIVKKNQELLGLETLQFLIAMAPFSKAIPFRYKYPKLATAASLMTKATFEMITEGPVEEGQQQFWQYQERLKYEGKLSKKAGTGSIFSDDYWEGYDEYSKTEEAQVAIREGMIGGLLFSGAGEVYSHFQDMREEAAEKKTMLQNTLDLLKSGTEKSFDIQQTKLRNNLFAQHAVKGTTENLINSLRQTREQMRPSMSEKANEGEDKKFMEHIATAQAFAEIGKGLKDLNISPLNKQKIVLATYGLTVVEANKETAIKNLTESQVPQAVINEVTKQYDASINLLNKEISKLTGKALKQKNDETTFAETFAGNAFAVAEDITLTPEEKLSKENDARDEHLDLLYKNRESKPTVDELFKDQPVDYEEIHAQQTEGKATKKDVKEVTDWLKGKKAYLENLLNNPNRIHHSSAIKEGIALVENELKYFEEKTKEPAQKPAEPTIAANKVTPVATEPVVTPAKKKRGRKPAVEKQGSGIVAGEGLKEQREKELNEFNFENKGQTKADFKSDEAEVSFNANPDGKTYSVKVSLKANTETGYLYSEALSDREIPNRSDAIEHLNTVLDRVKKKINTKYDALDKNKEQVAEAPKEHVEKASKAKENTAKADAARKKIEKHITSLTITPQRGEEETDIKSQIEESKKRIAELKKKKAETKKGPELNTGINPGFNSEEDHAIFQEYVNIAKLHLKDKFSKIKTAAHFAKEIGEKLTKTIIQAWEKAKAEIAEENKQTRKEVKGKEKKQPRIPKVFGLTNPDDQLHLLRLAKNATNGPKEFASSLGSAYNHIQKLSVTEKEKQTAYNEFRKMVSEAFDFELTGTQADIPILMEMGFTEEDANFVSEKFDSYSYDSDKQDRQVEKIKHLWNPVNENGEIIGIKDNYGDVIPERTVYDEIQKYVDTVKKTPKDLKAFFASMPGNIGKHLSIQKEGDLRTLFNTFKSTTRQQYFHLTDKSFSKTGEKNLIDINDSNVERIDQSMVDKLAKKVKHKYNVSPTEQEKQKKDFAEDYTAFTNAANKIKGEISKLHKELSDTKTKRNNAIKAVSKGEGTMLEANVYIDKIGEIREKMATEVNKLVVEQSRFLAKITGIEQSVWENSVNVEKLAKDIERYSGNSLSWMELHLLTSNNFTYFKQNLLEGVKGQRPQLTSLVDNIRSAKRSRNKTRNFKTVDGVQKNADNYKSYLDFRIEDLNDAAIQAQYSWNPWVARFKNRPPAIAYMEGEKINDEGVSTKDIYPGDIIIAALHDFIKSRYADKGYYMQVFEQQTDKSTKIFMEAPKWTIAEAEKHIEQFGLAKKAKIESDIKFVNDIINSFRSFLDESHSPVTTSITKEFVLNYVVNKYFQDEYFQPEKNITGDLNWTNYADKVKRNSDSNGVGLDENIMGEEMTAAVVEDFDVGKYKKIPDGVYYVSEKRGQLIQEAGGTLANYGNSVKATYNAHDANNTRTYLKGHGVVLTAELAKTNPTLQKLYDYMQEHELDILGFKSSFKWFDKNALLKFPWNGNKLSDGVLPAPVKIMLKTRNFLIQQNLKQDPSLSSRDITRQMFYYAQRFGRYQEIQKKFNQIVAAKYKEFNSKFIKATEEEQKDFIASLLPKFSDKYDHFRRYLADPKSSLANIYWQPIIQSLIAGHIESKVLAIQGNKQLSIEVPLVGQDLKSVRIENGKIEPGEVLLPAAYAKDLKIGDVVFVTRVPSTELHSTTPLKIAGFLPESAGNIIITDTATQKLAGADNDGDMRHIWAPYKNPVKGSAEEKMNEVFDIMLEEYLADKKSEEEVELRFREITEPIDTKANDGLLTAHRTRLNKNMSPLSIESYTKQVENNLDGKMTIAIGARMNAAYNYLEDNNATLVEPVVIPKFTIDENGKVINQEGDVTLRRFSHSLADTHEIRKVLANFLNHSTDNTKLGNLEYMGINRHTAGLAYMLVGLGMEEKQVYDFLNHPIVERYTKLARKYSSPFNGNEKTDIYKIMVEQMDGEDMKSVYNPSAQWFDKSRRPSLSTADVSGDGKIAKMNMLKTVHYLMEIANSISDFSQLEKLNYEPVSGLYDYLKFDGKLSLFQSGKMKYSAPSLVAGDALTNAELGLNAFYNFAKQYFPLMSTMGRNLAEDIKALSVFDKKLNSTEAQEKINNALSKVFIIDALQIEESKEELAGLAKKVYDGLSEENPLKTLLKWDEKKNRLTVNEQFKIGLNESEKEVYRNEFQQLREKANLQMMGPEKVGKKQTISDWEILLKHQAKEYGWNYSPLLGEYSSFMDLGTQMRVGEAMKDTFDIWNGLDFEMNTTGYSDAILKQVQLANTSLIPKVRVTNLGVFNEKDQKIKSGNGYVYVYENGTKMVYDLFELINNRKEAKGKEMPKAYDVKTLDQFTEKFIKPEAEQKMELVEEPMDKEMSPIENVDFMATTTMDEILEGRRTSTTRGYWHNAVQGKVKRVENLVGRKLTFKDKQGRTAVVKVTGVHRITPADRTNKEFLKQWSEKERWTREYLLANTKVGEYQVEFQLIKANKKPTSTNNILPEYQGKIVYGTLTMGKSDLAKKNDNVVDFDGLLAEEYNKEMEDILKSPGYNVADAENVGKLIYPMFRIMGKTAQGTSNVDLRIYIPALEKAKAKADQGKTVVMGSKDWISKSVILPNGETYSFEVDHAFQSDDYTAMKERFTFEDTDTDEIIKERAEKFRNNIPKNEYGKLGENQMLDKLPAEKVSKGHMNKMEEILTGEKQEIPTQETYNYSDYKDLLLAKDSEMTEQVWKSLPLSEQRQIIKCL